MYLSKLRNVFVHIGKYIAQTFICKRRDTMIHLNNMLLLDKAHHSWTSWSIENEELKEPSGHVGYDFVIGGLQICKAKQYFLEFEPLYPNSFSSVIITNK